MADNTLIPFSILDAGDAVDFYFFYFFVSDVSHTELVFCLGQIDNFLVRPPSFLGTFGQSNSLLKIFSPNCIVFCFSVVLIAFYLTMSM